MKRLQFVAVGGAVRDSSVGQYAIHVEHEKLNQRRPLGQVGHGHAARFSRISLRNANQIGDVEHSGRPAFGIYHRQFADLAPARREFDCLFSASAAANSVRMGR